MTDKEITQIIKEWMVENKFPYGWEEGFLDACQGCEEHWENTEENKKPLIDNYLLWGQWEDWKNEK
tara:strand:+ start:722 stop:919 length:198 start_codon:yes stop_codon:yes gene_type:complete